MARVKIKRARVAHRKIKIENERHSRREKESVLKTDMLSYGYE